MQDFFEWLDRMALALALTLFGGLAHAAKSGQKTLAGWLCCILVGWFSGIVTYMILTELFTQVSQLTAAALSSACASTGGVYLDSVINNLAEITGHKLSKKDADHEQDRQA